MESSRRHSFRAGVQRRVHKDARELPTPRQSALGAQVLNSRPRQASERFIRPGAIVLNHSVPLEVSYG